MNTKRILTRALLVAIALLFTITIAHTAGIDEPGIIAITTIGALVLSWIATSGSISND